jgi:hypothetical protein
VRIQAEAAGLSVSAYCRRRVLGHPILAAVDRAVLRELRRIGGLAKAMHVESGGAYSQDTAAAWRAVTAAINRLGREPS